MREKEVPDESFAWPCSAFGVLKSSVTHPQFDLYTLGFKSAFLGLRACSSVTESLENSGYGWLVWLSDHEAAYLTLRW